MNKVLIYQTFKQVVIILYMLEINTHKKLVTKTAFFLLQTDLFEKLKITSKNFEPVFHIKLRLFFPQAEYTCVSMKRSRIYFDCILEINLRSN